MLGCPGLLRAWRAGNVALANAPGCGVADDKMVYTYVPDFIRYYLDQDPIIPNVPTYKCVNKDERDHVIQNIADMVIKPANESGGYGMLIGPQASTTCCRARVSCPISAASACMYNGAGAWHCAANCARAALKDSPTVRAAVTANRLAAPTTSVSNVNRGFSSSVTRVPLG